LIYAAYVNILGGSIYAIKKYTETLVTASKESELEVKGDKTEYMVMSQDQNGGQSHKIKTDNNCFERAKQFKYLRTVLSNQNSIQEDIKSTWKSRNACYCSAQNLLSSSLLSKNMMIKMFRTIILAVVLYRCELGHSH